MYTKGGVNGTELKMLTLNDGAQNKYLNQFKKEIDATPGVDFGGDRTLFRYENINTKNIQKLGNYIDYTQTVIIE